jgi:hypothetical protein
MLFALGYPHIVVPTDDPLPDDIKDADALHKRFPLRTTHVPRAFLPRYFAAVRKGANEQGVAQALATEPPPWTDEKLKSQVERAFEAGSLYSYDVLLLEAMVGSARFAEVAVERLEAYPEAAWDEAGGDLDTYGGDALGKLYFVLLRTPAALRDALVKRLESLYERIGKVRFENGSRAHKALDVVLHGHAGVERSGYRSAEGDVFYDLIYADDNPRYVEDNALAVLARLKPADRAQFDLRIAFLGGAKVVSALKAGTAKFHSTQRKEIARQLEHLPA